MKFDCCLGNPPYDKGLHIRFLEKMGKIAHNVVSIQPINMFQDNYVFKKPIKYDVYCDDVEVIPNKIASNIFNASIKTDLGIIIINEKRELDTSKLNLFDKKTKYIIDKLLEKLVHLDRLKNHLYKNKHGIFLKFNDGAPFNRTGFTAYCMTSPNYEIGTSNKETGHTKYVNDIENINVLKNMQDFYVSNFMRFWMWKLCNGNPNHEFIPFLDFSVPITNEKIKKIFGLSDEDLKYIDDIINPIKHKNEEVDKKK